MASGTVHEWHDEQGWGVLDSPWTPGGCWFHYSALDPGRPRRPAPGDRACFVWEVAEQDRWSFRAEAVWLGDTATLLPTPHAAAVDPADVAGVLDAAQRRADGLVSGDPDNLTYLLRPEFVWTSHRGAVLDREAYVRGNTDGTLRWVEQRIEGPAVRAVGATAVLTAVVHDRVVRDGAEQSFAMPVTQTWVHADGRWQCLAGHAGPLR